MKTRKELLKKLMKDIELDESSIEMVNLQGFDGGHRALIRLKHGQHLRQTWYYTKVTDEESAVRELETKALTDLYTPDDYVVDEEKAVKEEPKKKKRKAPVKKEKTVTFDRNDQIHINSIITMLDKSFGAKWREKAPLVKAYNDEITGKAEIFGADGKMLEEFKTNYLEMFKGL